MCLCSRILVPYARDVLHKLSQTGNSMVVLHYTCVVFPVPSYGEILRFGRWLGRSWSVCETPCLVMHLSLRSL
jgi:hypothetical protein